MEFDRVNCFDKLSVRIPRDWSESDDEDDKTCGFFDPAGVFGTLRVSLITKSLSSPISLATVQKEDFEQRQEDNVRFFRGDEFVIAEWDQPGFKESDIHIYYWTVTAIVSTKQTKQMRKALFSYTVPVELLKKPNFQQNLAVVRDCVFAVHFCEEVTN